MPSRTFSALQDATRRATPPLTKVGLALATALFTLGVGLMQPLGATTDIAFPGPVAAHDTPPVHDASIGALAGEAKVEGGAAVYTIPITVPPGRMGLQPALSLNYSSRSGMGTAGLGWSLSGLSSLHRCPRTPEQDGETRAVQLDANDRLCLDGQRLLVVDANLAPIAGQAGYGSASATYRTEVDTFVRVTQYGGSLTEADSCFKVEMKSGRIGYYGGLPTESTCSGDARVVPGGATVPLSWMLRQEIDPLGNTINYHYANSDANGAYGAGEMLLQSIDYTGHDGEPGDRSVTFVYTPSTGLDRTSSYAGGGLTEQTQLLTGIGTYDGDGPVRSY